MVGTNDATIYEVARRSGVSISTVSLAINHPERVKSATRERILAVADDIGFVPKENAIARARAGVGRIAVVAPFTSYPSFARRAAGVLEALGKDGTQLLVYDHEDVATSGSPLLASIPIRGHVDGLVIMAIPIDEKIASRLRSRLPTVLVDIAHDGLPSVMVDDFAGGRMVGERLVEWGHSRVGFVREQELSFLKDSPTQLRLNGLVSVLGRENVTEVTVSRTPSAGAEAVQALLSGDQSGSTRPTAIFTNRDLVALSVLRAATARGLRVPSDLSVVGFDDDPMSEAVGLTTVANPFEASGQRAMEMLWERIQNPTLSPSTVLLPLEFKERDTAGPATEVRDLRNSL